MFHFGVITSDAIPAKSIYLYKNDEERIVGETSYFKEPKPFESLLQPGASRIRNQKYAKSVVAATKLLTSVDKGDKAKKKNIRILSSSGRLIFLS